MTKPPKMKKKEGNFKKSQTALENNKNNKTRLVLFIIITAALAAIPFSMGKYIEFNTSGAFDSGAYVYSAKHILDGAVIGVDETPSAQPGTLMVNVLGVWMFGFNDTGPEIIQAILQIAALILMFVAIRKAFGNLPAAIAVIIAATYLCAPLIAKFGNVKEQYMIAFMTLGISALVIRQLDGHWFWAILAGACLAWGPLFKPTGTTAIGATVIFIILQPVLKNTTWKKTLIDIMLLFAGAAIGLAPAYLWFIMKDAPVNYWPYSFVWKTLLPAKGAAATAKTGGYVKKARELIPFAKQYPRVLRYYWALNLPIALATLAIGARFIKMLRAKFAKINNKTKYDKLVLLLAVWWILDMAFVWISPRSYEQYYLPLNASAAMLGAYLIALYTDKFAKTIYKPRWTALGLIALACMVFMSWNIFAGITKSPHSGADYGKRKRGYIPKVKEVRNIKKNNYSFPWQVAGDYIRLNSTPNDKIYVWGWYPGIYVQAQRLSAAKKACMMPRPAPARFEKTINSLIEQFQKQKPLFIVDSRKRHIPMDRPPYELWPKVPKGFMGAKKAAFLPPDNKKMIDYYDAEWAKMLRNRFDEEEAQRYEMLKPFREYVRNNYSIVQVFGEHVVFKLNK
ncbi:MAG: hypothetical protein FVQ80_03575 [Planctomycetes bacterium]|nr:hypothetical protein [Planctomycetota bacterium]